MKGNKKKIIILGSILSGVVIVCGVLFGLYHQTGNYIVEKMIATEITQTLKEAGIDLSAENRLLTEEELHIVEKHTHIRNQEDTVEQERKKESEKDYTTKLQSDTKQQVNKPTTTTELKKVVEEKAKYIAKQVNQKDRLAMTQLVMNNLSTAQINELLGLVINGISKEDLSRAKVIALQSFSAKELEQVRGYYEKYKHLIP